PDKCARVDHSDQLPVCIGSYLPFRAYVPLRKSGRWEDGGDDRGGPFSVVVGVRAAHPNERGSGVVPLGNDGPKIVAGGVARDRNPGPFTGLLLACTAKQFVVSAVVRLTDQWSAADWIGVGRNVNAVGIL